MSKPFLSFFYILSYAAVGFCQKREKEFIFSLILSKTGGKEGYEVNVGQGSRERGLAKNMTQKELAEQVQITQPMLCQIERGTKTPTVLLAWEIAKVLDFELNDYVSEKS